jgi:hypothetical protein
MSSAALRNTVVIIAVVAVAWLGWGWMFPDDEAQIREVLDRIAEGVSGGSSEGEVGRLARAASLRNDFDPDIVVDAGAPFARLKGRDAVIGTAARLSGSMRNLEITFADVEIQVSADRAQAHAAMTAEARFDEGAGGRGIDARELDVSFRRLDGRWVVSEVALIRALQPLDAR